MKALIFAALTVGFSFSAFAGDYQLESGQMLTYTDGTTVSCDAPDSGATYQLDLGQIMTMSNGDTISCN